MLNLDSNKITVIDSIKGLDKLQYRNQSNNQINDIHFIANKPTLTELHIANNHIKSISSLKNLK